MNTIKNEVEIDLGDRKYTLRPTFSCLVAIEARTGKSLVQMTQEIAQQRGSLTDAIVVIEEGAKAAGNPITKDELMAIIEEIGVMPFQMSLASFMGTALYGGDLSDELSKKKTQMKSMSRSTESPGTNSLVQPLGS